MTTSTTHEQETAQATAAEKLKAPKKARAAARQAQVAAPPAKPGKKTSPLEKSAQAGKKRKGARHGSKTAKVLDLLKRSGGATLKDLIAYASHCTSLGRCEGFSLTKGLFDNLTPLPFCGGLGPGFS